MSTTTHQVDIPSSIPDWRSSGPGSWGDDPRGRAARRLAAGRRGRHGAPRRAGRGARGRYGVGTTTDNTAAVRGAGVVVVAVKPKDVAALLAEIADHLGEGTVVVSVVVGLASRFYEDRLPAARRSCGSCRTPRR
ncbi:NAD(P)-binding domain-containing protein [Oerskovia sp. M15]